MLLESEVWLCSFFGFVFFQQITFAGDVWEATSASLFESLQKRKEASQRELVRENIWKIFKNIFNRNKHLKAVCKSNFHEKTNFKVQIFVREMRTVRITIVNFSHVAGLSRRSEFR